MIYDNNDGPIYSTLMGKPPLATEYSVGFGGTGTPYGGTPCYLKVQSTVYSGTVSGCGGSLTINGATYAVNTDWVASTAGASGSMVTAQLQSAGLGNAASDFTGFVPGRIALVQRGVQPFQTKVNNAIAAGAVGVIIYNNTTGLTSPSVTASIPVIMITQALGSSLVSQSNVSVSFDGGAAKLQVEVVGGSGTINGGGKSGFKYSTANIVNAGTYLSCPAGVSQRFQYDFTPVAGIDFSHTLRQAVGTLGEAYADVVEVYGSGDLNGCAEAFTLICYDSSGNLISRIVLLDGTTKAFAGTDNGNPLGNINLPVGTKRVDLEILENSNRLDIASNNCDAVKSAFVGSSAWYYKMFIKE